MYALIYDEHNLEDPRKKVISTHNTRKQAEKALEKRKAELGKTVEECNTRIVWTTKAIGPDGILYEGEFETWAPGEPVPYGELHSDTD